MQRLTLLQEHLEEIVTTLVGELLLLLDLHLLLEPGDGFAVGHRVNKTKPTQWLSIA